MIGIRTSTTRQRFSRRSLLKGMGVSAAFLPLLEAEPAQGADGTPKRLVTVTWTNGMPGPNFWPATDTDPTASDVLKPLAALKAKVLVAAAVDCKIMLDGNHKYDGHFSYPVLWTGTYKNTGGQNCAATGPSLDQVYSDHVATTANLPIPLLAISMVGGKGTSFRAGGVANSAQTDPAKLFTQSFSGGAATPPPVVGGVAVPPQLRRKSILDWVKDDLQTFAGRLGTVDKGKISAHLESIRQLELQLTATTGTGGGTTPATGSVSCKATAPAGGNAYEAKLKAFLDLTAIALRCDLTRSVSLVLGADGGSGPSSWPALGIGDYHGLAHQGASGYATKVKVDSYYFSQIAYLAQQLESTAEGSLTALDNTLIGVTNDMNEGAEHYVGRLPFVIVGNTQGASAPTFKSGRVVRLGTWAGKTGTYWKSDSGVAHNLVLAAMAGALGVSGSAESFGTGYPGTVANLFK